MMLKNQERMIKILEQMLENQRIMIDLLKRIAHALSRVHEDRQ